MVSLKIHKRNNRIMQQFGHMSYILLRALHQTIFHPGYHLKEEVKNSIAHIVVLY
jgi:nucleoid DNA-binding protein